MKKMSNRDRAAFYYDRHRLELIFDSDCLEHAQVHCFAKDESVLVAGDTLNYYYLLVEGKVKVTYLFENGKSMLLKVYKPLHPIGDIELLKGKPIRCNVDAMEEACFFAIPVSVIQEKYMENPKFLRHLVESLSDKLESTINNVSYNHVYPLINRLASYLLEMMDEQGSIVLDTSYKDMAHFFGTTYRHLNRTFNEMVSEGLLQYDEEHIQVTNEPLLRDLAKNTYWLSK